MKAAEGEERKRGGGVAATAGIAWRGGVAAAKAATTAAGSA